VHFLPGQQTDFPHRSNPVIIRINGLPQRASLVATSYFPRAGHVARGPERATLEIGARRDPASGKWCFIILGAGRKVMHQSEMVYETEHEAKAAARDWLTQTMLR